MSRADVVGVVAGTAVVLAVATAAGAQLCMALAASAMAVVAGAHTAGDVDAEGGSVGTGRNGGDAGHRWVSFCL